MEITGENDTSLRQPAESAASLHKFAFSESSPASNTRRVTRSSISATSTPTSSTSDRHPKMKSPSPSSPKASLLQSRLNFTPTKRSGPTSASTTSHSPITKKRKRASAGYRPPSYYAHLPNHLIDSLAPNLITLFIGVNPGLRTAATGHAYSHPSNLFWKLAYSSGCTPRLCKPSEDRDLPRLWALGHTNIVTRQTKDASELSAQEMEDGVAVLEEKCRRWRPESVCFVGKGIWEAVWRVWKGRPLTKQEFRYGWQDENETVEEGGRQMGTIRNQDGEVEWPGARVFVATTTSGLAAGMRPWEKEEVWKGLGEWVKKRRQERGIPDEGGVSKTNG